MGHHLLLEDVDWNRSFDALTIELLLELLLAWLGLHLRVLLSQLLVLLPVTHYLVLIAVRVVLQQIFLDEPGDHHLLDLLQLLVLLPHLRQLLPLLVQLLLLLLELFHLGLDLLLPLLLHRPYSLELCLGPSSLSIVCEELMRYALGD